MDNDISRRKLTVSQIRTCGIFFVFGFIIIAVLLINNISNSSQLEPLPPTNNYLITTGPPPTIEAVLNETLAAHSPLPNITQTETPIPEIPLASSTQVPSPTSIISDPIIYGHSFGGRELIAYKIGNGPVIRAIIGGIHGGYEWNTTTLVNDILGYLRENPESIPAELTLYVIPLANPDGAAAGTDRVFGRMNGNGVDLNRNWDFQWQSVATHGTSPVSAGQAPFSEPETANLRDLILQQDMQAVVFYHSAMSEVYPGVGFDTSKTEELAKLFSSITGYRYAPEGIPGQVTTGDAADYLTVNGITAVEVDLSSHEAIDWELNLQAFKAFLKWDLEE